MGIQKWIRKLLKREIIRVVRIPVLKKDERLLFIMKETTKSEDVKEFMESLRISIAGEEFTVTNVERVYRLKKDQQIEVKADDTVVEETDSPKTDGQPGTQDPSEEETDNTGDGDGVESPSGNNPY